VPERTALQALPPRQRRPWRQMMVSGRSLNLFLWIGIEGVVAVLEQFWRKMVALYQLD
jgi:hypothetical protein